ncbi:hypothetical protein HanIR_Chr02g0096091 [Helianthus annuus]|nr:hypothetical protein HanIR_Chr02g0096091 [Helianthus annuus]
MILFCNLRCRALDGNDFLRRLFRFHFLFTVSLLEVCFSLFICTVRILNFSKKKKKKKTKIYI